MVIGKWLPDVTVGEISYYEAKVSWELGGEIALLRVVKTSDGKWMPMIREATGQVHTLGSAQQNAISFLKRLSTKFTRAARMDGN